MKNLKVLLLFVGVFATTSLIAQNSSRLSGKEFKVFVNKTELPGPETQIEDILTFTGSKVSSQHANARGSKPARYTETLEGTRTKFQMTISQPNGEVWVYDGFMEDNHLWGSLSITRSGQAPESWEFRGMTTQLWNATLQRREAERSSY